MDNKEKKSLQIYIDDWEKLKKLSIDLQEPLAEVVKLILKENGKI